jgi:hypothetical protein
MTAHSLVHQEAAQAPRRRLRQLVRLGWPHFLYIGGLLGLLGLVSVLVGAMFVSAS